MTRNSLDLKSQLMIVEALKKGEPWQDITYEEIAKKIEADLQIPLTGNNIKGIVKAADIKVGRSDPQEQMAKTICEAIHWLYVDSPKQMPKKFQDICKALKVSE